MKAGPNQASRLVVLAEEAGAELFTSTSGETFATLDLGDHRETWPLHARAFKTWLARLYWLREQGAPNSQAMQDALSVLDGKARYASPVYDVATRLAALEGVLYLDLGDEHWHAVEIDMDGWRIISDPPIRFRRTAAMAALPQPTTGGSLEDLRPFVNVGTDDSWILFAACLLGAFHPTGPYPVLGLHGIHGSAKTSAARAYRALIDPSASPLRAAPRNEHDLAIAAQNGWVIALDNVSGLSQWISDALCRVSTGGGLATRTLYTTDEETIFQSTRPIILTGIEDVASSGDLLDRSIVLHLPEIPEARRRDEERLWAAFEKAKPGILGAILDAVSAGLRNLDSVQLERVPRMADFARWVSACEPALGWTHGSFLAAYTGNRAQTHELAIEAEIVGTPLRALAETGFEGTALELLTALTDSVDERLARAKAWPKSARDLAGRVRRLTPHLRGAGVDVELPAPNARPRTYRMGAQNTVGIDVTDRTRMDTGLSAVDVGAEIVATPSETDGRRRSPDDPRGDIDAQNPTWIHASDGPDDPDGLSQPHSENGSPAQTTFKLDPDEIEEWAEVAREVIAEASSS